MKGIVKNYHYGFLALADALQVTDCRGENIPFYEGVEHVCRIIKKQSKKGGKVFFIGNGGSAAIASHMAIDFWRNGTIQAMAFSDSPLLTCISNDFGYEHVFAKPIEFFGRENDLLFAISSSGKSKNIIKGAQAMLEKGSPVITLTGFGKSNPLRAKGMYNFYVPSCHYGAVEVLHQYICHLILDVIMHKQNEGYQRRK